MAVMLGQLHEYYYCFDKCMGYLSGILMHIQRMCRSIGTFLSTCKHTASESYVQTDRQRQCCNDKTIVHSVAHQISDRILTFFGASLL